MPLTLTNTLTRTKEVFTPLVPGHVGIYVCGPTVYSHSHVDHYGGVRGIVDEKDDDVIAQGMARHLTAAGFDAVGVANGETGLARRVVLCDPPAAWRRRT